MANNVVEGPRLKDEAPGIPVLQGGQQIGWRPISEPQASRTGSMIGDDALYGLDAWPENKPSGWGIYWSPVFEKLLDDNGKVVGVTGTIQSLEQVRLPATSDAVALYTDPRREVPLEFVR